MISMVSNYGHWLCERLSNYSYHKCSLVKLLFIFPLMINESSSIQGMRIDLLPRIKKKKKKKCLLFALGKGSIFVLRRLHAGTLFLSTALSKVALSKVNMKFNLLRIYS